MSDKTLRIKEGVKPGTYRFLIDDVDISKHIDRAELILYYGCEADEPRRSRLIMGSRTQQLPERYSMTIHRGQTNGSVHTSNADDRQDASKA
jgi:hypothetical protein